MKTIETRFAGIEKLQPAKNTKDLTRRHGATEAARAAGQFKSEELREKSEECRIYRVANVWQKWLDFAKHWQIHPPRGFQILPTLGKIEGNLPSIGNTVFSGEPGLPRPAAVSARGGR